MNVLRSRSLRLCIQSKYNASSIGRIEQQLKIINLRKQAKKLVSSSAGNARRMQLFEAGKHKSMRASAEDACEFLGALGQETRLVIVCILAEGEKSVLELQAILRLRQPTISQHLAMLRKHQLVTAKREGRSVRYALDSHKARMLIHVLYDVYS